MTGKDIVEALSFVDETYIEEAENGKIRRGNPARYLLPLAACLCLILSVARLIPVPQAAPSEGAQQEPGMAMDIEVQQEHSKNDIPMEPVFGSNDIQSPGLGEVPSVVLCIIEWTEGGFTASVDSLVDTDLIPVGTVINVQMVPNMVVETIDGDLVYAERRIPTEADFPAGCLIRVMFCSYSAEDKLLTIESVCKEDG